MCALSIKVPIWKKSGNLFNGPRISFFINRRTWTGHDTRPIFKQSLTGLNSEFSLSQISCLSKAKQPSLLYYLPIAAKRIIGFMPFLRVLVLCEMQSASSRIWTRVTASISYYYIMGTSLYICIIEKRNKPSFGYYKFISPGKKKPASSDNHHTAPCSFNLQTTMSCYNFKFDKDLIRAGLKTGIYGRDLIHESLYTLLHLSSQQRNKFLHFCSTIVNIVFSFVNISTLHI